MPANKAPRKKKPTRVRRNPSGILNRLTVPDDRIHRLKKRADAELMRLYMRGRLFGHRVPEHHAGTRPGHAQVR